MAKPRNQRAPSQSVTPGSDSYPEQKYLARWLTFAGAVLLVTYVLIHAMKSERPSNWRLEMALDFAGSLATVACFVSLGVAAVATLAHKMTDRSLKKIDFAWMSFAALGLALSLGQTLASTNEIIRSEIDKQLDSYRIEMIRLTDVLHVLVCETSGTTDKQLCDAVNGASVMATSVLRVPTAEQEAVICSPRSRGNDTIIAALASLCTEIRKTQGMKASAAQISDANETLRFGVLPLWQVVLSLALGLRLAKSVVEVGWLRIGSPTKLPSPGGRAAKPPRS